MKPQILSFVFRNFEALSSHPGVASKGISYCPGKPLIPVKPVSTMPKTAEDEFGNMWRLSVYPGGDGDNSDSSDDESGDEESESREDKGIGFSLKRANHSMTLPVKAKVAIIVRDSTGNSFRDLVYERRYDFRATRDHYYHSYVTRAEKSSTKTFSSPTEDLQLTLRFSLWTGTKSSSNQIPLRRTC